MACRHSANSSSDGKVMVIDARRSMGEGVVAMGEGVVAMGEGVVAITAVKGSSI